MKKRARTMKDSNALLQDHCVYTDRESLGMQYKMIELRHAGLVTSDMTSEIQAMELSGAPQCEACNLSQYFACGPPDRNIYEIGRFRGSPAALGACASGRFVRCDSNPEFPPPPVEAMPDQHQAEDNRSCVLDLVPQPSPKPQQQPQPGLDSSAAAAKTLKANPRPCSGASADSLLGNKGPAAHDKLPVDLTAPCSYR